MQKASKDRVLNLGTYAGIPVKIHWTFGFLILFVIYTSYTEHLSIKTGLYFFLYILILFLCVTLHEYGHALMGRKYGVHTGEILLTPIGGIAKMGAMSPKPKHELLIALAGPMVNVVIAIILSGFIYFFLDAQFLPLTDDYSIFSNPPDLVRMVLLMNIVLFTFNLIPAYPMDGGRVLRSLIAMRTGFDKATVFATYVGMLLALGFFGLAVYLPHPTLGFIGVFIFFMANKERVLAKKNLLLDTPIEPYINKSFTLLSYQDTFEKVYAITKDPHMVEKDFLVVDESKKIMGSLPFEYIKEAQKQAENYQYVHEFMQSDYGSIDCQTSIKTTAYYMNDNGYHVIAVMKDGNLIGTIDRTIIKKLF